MGGGGCVPPPPRAHSSGTPLPPGRSLVCERRAARREQPRPPCRPPCLADAPPHLSAGLEGMLGHGSGQGTNPRLKRKVYVARECHAHSSRDGRLEGAR